MIHAAESAFNDGLQVSPGLGILLNGLSEVRRRWMLDAYGDQMQMFPCPFITVSWSAALASELSSSMQCPATPTSTPLPAPELPTAEHSSISDHEASETASKPNNACEVLSGNNVSMFEERGESVCPHTAQVCISVHALGGPARARVVARFRLPATLRTRTRITSPILTCVGVLGQPFSNGYGGDHEALESKDEGAEPSGTAHPPSHAHGQLQHRQPRDRRESIGWSECGRNPESSLLDSPAPTETDAAPKKVGGGSPCSADTPNLFSNPLDAKRSGKSNRTRRARGFNIADAPSRELSPASRCSTPPVDDSDTPSPDSCHTLTPSASESNDEWQLGTRHGHEAAVRHAAASASSHTGPFNSRRILARGAEERSRKRQDGECNGCSGRAGDSSRAWGPAEGLGVESCMLAIHPVADSLDLNGRGLEVLPGSVQFLVG